MPVAHHVTPGISGSSVPPMTAPCLPWDVTGPDIYISNTSATADYDVNTSLGGVLTQFIQYKRLESHSWEAQQDPWRKEFTSKLIELASLPAGWDDAGSSPVRRSAIEIALRFLDSDLVRDLPTKPSIVPTVDGNLVFEWHTEHMDLTLEPRPDWWTTNFYVLDNETGEESEGLVAEQLPRLTTAFQKLASG